MAPHRPLHANGSFIRWRGRPFTWKPDVICICFRDRAGGGGDDDFLVMINPQIIQRSPEVEARVWNERCLVLPPTFNATVVRDAVIDVQYRTVNGQVRVVQLHDELARALQHELDHDRGILVTDHLGLPELENDVMRQLEAPGHDERMQLAFDRYVYEPWVRTT